MDIGSLEVLIAAVEEKSLSRAAERENLVTSAASKRISELERQVGTALLVRHGRGVEPTPAGAMLYQRARAIVRSIKLAEEALATYSTDGIAKIRLAANPSTILQFLPTDISGFLQSAPDSRIDLIEALSFDIPRMVSNGDADIGIYHAEAPSPGVFSLPYRSDRVGLVVPRGHPLEAKGSLQLEEALDYDFLGYFPRYTFEAFLQLVSSTISRPLTVKTQVSNFEARCRMVREGLGIAVVPEGIAKNYLSMMGLSLLTLTDAWAERNFYVCVRDRQSPPAGTAKLLDYLSQCATMERHYQRAR
ncbi:MULTISPECIES: LysR family transcriptional regulator [Cupriavidus]|uniref:LysR family transcriptional regulator n=1 Tax=Cupriavidus TaxID=106589 RepID=UPI0016009F84|nr:MULTISPECIES: LysR family transcriptional regulator [Cupriavidus]MBB1631930.1 LysR family transcriptional regulator [Cupriavidus sp. UME77]MCP3025074.1 LysR family transcriptional regulator [Cupriavidus basilensis]